MPEDEYHAADGLSSSGMKKLAVSPLHYYHHCLDADRAEQTPSPEMLFGSAAHCRLLEPERFATAYAAEWVDDPTALDTMEDMRNWLVGVNLPAKGTRKQDLVDRILGSGLPVAIKAVEQARHAAEHAGKRMLSAKDAARLDRLADAFRSDAHARGLLLGGAAEVSFFVEESESGVMLKSRMDYVRPDLTVDVKTWSNQRGKPIDRALAETIVYEGYHVQHGLYDAVRRQARDQLRAGEIRCHGEAPVGWLEGFLACAEPRFVLAFVESHPPHEVRLVEMARKESEGGHPTIYHSAAMAQIDAMLDRYALCRRKYGPAPWREARPPRVLLDSDLPSSMFS